MTSNPVPISVVSARPFQFPGPAVRIRVLVMFDEHVVREKFRVAAYVDTTNPLEAKMVTQRLQARSQPHVDAAVIRNRKIKKRNKLFYVTERSDVTLFESIT